MDYISVQIMVQFGEYLKTYTLNGRITQFMVIIQEEV